MSNGLTCGDGQRAEEPFIRDARDGFLQRFNSRDMRVADAVLTFFTSNFF